MYRDLHAEVIVFDGCIEYGATAENSQRQISGLGGATAVERAYSDATVAEPGR